MIRALPPLELDLHAAPRTGTWAARALLAVAVAFSVDVGVSYDTARREAAAAETRLAKAERIREGTGASRRRLGVQPTPEAIHEGRETYLRLATPWGDLFHSLETAAADDVLLLAIEPDPRAGTVLVSGSARDYAAVLGYVTGLQRQNLLTRVHLVRHEIQQEDRSRAVGFTVAATWKEARR